MNPFDCVKIDNGYGPETLSEVFYRTLAKKPSSQSYYRQTLFVFSEGDASVSMKRRHLNITTQFVEEKFSVLSSTKEVSIPFLITVYRNWLTDKSRRHHYLNYQEIPMTEITTEFAEQLEREDRWTESLVLINEELLKRITSPDRRTRLIAQLHFDEFGFTTGEDVAKILGVGLRRVQQLKSIMSNEIKMSVLSRQAGV